MGQKHHKITLEEMQNGIIGSCGILAEVGRRIEQIRRLKAAERFKQLNGVTLDVAFQSVKIEPIGWDALKRALKKHKLEAALKDQEEVALQRTEANILRAASEQENNLEAQKFVLDRRGRKRGWGREDTINHKGNAITVNISKTEDAR